MSLIQYSIRDLENFTQIKAHTIRIWEQRYGLLSPKRSSTNIRYYTENDLKKILNINLLYNQGYKISKIALLSEVEIIEHTTSFLHDFPENNRSEIDQLTLMILAFNKSGIINFIEKALDRQEMDDFYQNIIIPLLDKIGDLWQVGSMDIAHEHFFSGIFRQTILSRIDKLTVNKNCSKKAILFLHEQEEHEFGLLMYYYLFKRKGYECYYFGQKVPLEDINSAYERINPEYVITTFTSKLDKKQLGRITSELFKMSSKSQIIVSGAQINTFKYLLPKEFHTLNSLAEFKEFI